jgi:hypothetical protein
MHSIATQHCLCLVKFRYFNAQSQTESRYKWDIKIEKLKNTRAVTAVAVAILRHRDGSAPLG